MKRQVAPVFRNATPDVRPGLGAWTPGSLPVPEELPRVGRKNTALPTQSWPVQRG